MDGGGTRGGVRFERREEFRVRKNGRKDKVIIERSAAEGLPEGWIKELIISRRARKLRKDRLFIDPKSGYIFHSFKDASRYVRTSVIGNHARKPKETVRDEDGSGNGKIRPLSGSTEDGSRGNFPEEKKMNFYVRNGKRKNVSSLDERSGYCKTSSKSIAPRSRVLQEEARKKEQRQDASGRELVPCNETDTAVLKDERVGKRVTRSQSKARKKDGRRDELGRKSGSSSNAKSEDRKVSSKLESVSVSSQTTEEEEEGSGEKGEAQDPTGRKPVSCSENEIANTRTKQAVERRVTRSQAKATNGDKPELKRKAEFNDALPQQPSKRLELEPVPEPRTRTKTRGPQEVPAVEQSGDARAGKCRELELGGKPALDGCETTVMPLSRAETEKSEGRSGKNLNVGYGRRNKKTGSPRVSARGRQAAVPALAEKNQLEHLSTADDSNNLASVPALAEKNGNSVAEPLSLDSTLADLWKDPCIAFAIKTLTGESLDLPNTAKVLTESNRDEQRGVTFFPRIPESSNTSGQRPGCSSELPVADIWKDPCIDFAIKTLTGAIPIEPEGQPESQLTTTQAPEERQNDCDHSREQHKAVSGGACFLPQQVGNSANLRFSPSFSNGI